MSMLEPRDVAKRIITAIKRNEVFVTVPTFSRYILPMKKWVFFIVYGCRCMNVLLFFFSFIPAKLCWAVMYRVIQGPQSMMGMRSYTEAVAA